MDLILIIAIGAIVAATGIINPKSKDTEEAKLRDGLRAPLRGKKRLR